jgi:hypothetical protein
VSARAFAGSIEVTDPDVQLYFLQRYSDGSPRSESGGTAKKAEVKLPTPGVSLPASLYDQPSVSKAFVRSLHLRPIARLKHLCSCIDSSRSPKFHSLDIPDSRLAVRISQKNVFTSNEDAS